MIRSYVYVTCVCGHKLDWPFWRHSTNPQPFVHHKRGGVDRTQGRSCRIIVDAHPTAPDYSSLHNVYRVPGSMSIETAMQTAAQVFASSSYRFYQPTTMAA